MRILILTPDGVGSTILQRLLTLSLYLEKVNVVNTHEITNGLSIVNGRIYKDLNLKYSQSLTKIIEILSSTDKDISLISRLAKYHLNGRKDPTDQTEKFFLFLQKFYDKKIMCVRKNVFEHAMSMSIREKSNLLNIYNKVDKDKVNQVKEVDENFFIHQCQQYVDYVNWADRHFGVVEKVFYEDLIIDTDMICEKITSHKDTFRKAFSVSMASILKMEQKYIQHLFLGNDDIDVDRHELQTLVKYRDICKSVIKQEIMLNIPIKNTTLSDKKNQIVNFGTCLDKFYKFSKNHNWIDQSLATYDFWNETHVC